jgi:hypothetical protein
MLGSLARFGLALIVITVLFAGTIGVLSPGIAHADSSTAHSAQVAVLAFDSDDAEEQADALTLALRSRIRASQGWSLTETSQSLGMLTAALRCPGKPIPADCEQRIGDQIKSERYIFGYVTKGPQAGQVTAEIHLYQKNKPDTVIRESYADNLKDQNDDTLRKIAQRVLDRLGGTAVGTIVVRMGTESGEVVVDGDKRVPLQNGTARLELGPGGHSVEVVANGQPPQKRNVLVSAGKETIVDFQLAAASNTPGGDQKGSDKPFPTRKVIGGAMAAVGVGLGVFAITRAVEYFDLKDQFDQGGWGDENKYVNGKQLRAEGKELHPCDTPRVPINGDADAGCNLHKDAVATSALAIVTGAAGVALIGVGAYLFFVSPSDEKSTTGTGKSKRDSKPNVTPMFGMGTGGISVTGRF